MLTKKRWWSKLSFLTRWEKRHVKTQEEALLWCQHSEISKILGMFSLSFFLLSFYISGPHLQQSSYLVYQSCPKKTADLCLFHSLPYSSLLLPDQIRRNQRPKQHTTLKLTLPAAPVPTWERLRAWWLVNMLQITAAYLGSEQGVSLSLWSSSGFLLKEYSPVPLIL